MPGTPPESPGKRSPYKARLYLFYLTPLFGRGNNSKKHGNSPGTIRHSPAGINEVICSNDTRVGSGSERAPGGGGDQGGDPENRGSLRSPPTPVCKILSFAAPTDPYDHDPPDDEGDITGYRTMNGSLIISSFWRYTGDRLFQERRRPPAGRPAIAWLLQTGTLRTCIPMRRKVLRCQAV